MNEPTQQRNQRVHIVSLTLTKLGDGLLNPKIVLAWLMTYVGASAGLIGLLVPIREAGALLPQLFTASRLRRVAIRKRWWIFGSVMQAISVFGIGISAIAFEGQAAGLLIVLWVALFALSRSISSVSYKDVLGKTVEKKKRGVTTGTAASLASAGVLLFGVLLTFEVLDRLSLVLGAIFFAALLWLIAGIVFTFLDEQPSELQATSKEKVWRAYLGYLKSDGELQKLLLVRALLTATAIAPPFLLLLAAGKGSSLLSQLGVLVIASSFATFVSGRLWGQFADRSTKLVFVLSGFLASGILIIATIATSYDLYETSWFLPVLLFVFLVLYQGVRTARTIHLVNLATEETRAAYTAISNTIIGVILLATSLFGVLAEATSTNSVIIVFSLMCALGAVVALTFRETA